MVGCLLSEIQQSLQRTSSTTSDLGADTGGWARWSLHSSCVPATSCILPLTLPQSSAWSEFASSYSEGGCFLPQAVGKQEPQPFFFGSLGNTDLLFSLGEEVQMHSTPVIWLRIDSAFIKSMEHLLYPKHNYRKLGNTAMKGTNKASVLMELRLLWRRQMNKAIRLFQILVVLWNI